MNKHLRRARCEASQARCEASQARRAAANIGRWAASVKSEKHRFTASIEAGYIEALRQRAANEGTSTGDLIRTAIATYIEAV